MLFLGQKLLSGRTYSIWIGKDLKNMVGEGEDPSPVIQFSVASQKSACYKILLVFACF
jgi:hypothetical protein